MLSSIFNRIKPSIIGMVHIKGLPGTPASKHSVQEIIEIACEEAHIYRNAKVDGLLLENMFDTPWTLLSEAGCCPEVTAAMTAVACAVRTVCPHMPIGVQILSAGNKQALAVAQAAGLNFIRAEGFVYSHVADEGLINACAGDLLRYRRQINAEHIHIFTDIKKKHCSHSITSDVSLVETAKAAELFRSDGLIVTGKSTGGTTDPSEVQEVQSAVQLPVLVGSGVTEGNLSDYMMADALIIGSHFKRDGQWQNDLLSERVQQFMSKVNCLRENQRSNERTEHGESGPFKDIYHEGQ